MAGAESDAPVVWAIAAMIAPATLFSVFAPALLVKGESESQAVTRYMLRWAGAESVTIFGLAAAFLGGPRWLPMAAALWALVLLLLAYPTDAASSGGAS